MKIGFKKDRPNGGTVRRGDEVIGEYRYLAYGWEFLSTPKDGKRVRCWRHLQKDMKDAVRKHYAP